jgi:hypothetical protein
MRGHMRKRAVLGEHDHEMPAAVTMSVEDVVLTEQSTELDIIQMLGEQRQAARWHHRLCPRVGTGPKHRQAPLVTGSDALPFATPVNLPAR